jgi:hypothetical protein
MPGKTYAQANFSLPLYWTEMALTRFYNSTLIAIETRSLVIPGNEESLVTIIVVMQPVQLVIELKQSSSKILRCAQNDNKLSLLN